MGGAFIPPIIALAIAALLWFTFAAVRARHGRMSDETLPDEPYARREEEIRRLKEEHAAASPSRTTHPERRP